MDNSNLTQADRRVIEEVLIQVRSWRELAAGDWEAAWSWNRAGINLQERCGLLMGELHANKKLMMVAPEVQSLIKRLNAIGEHFEHLDQFAADELSNDPDAVDYEWKSQLARVDEVVGLIRNLDGKLPLESDSKAVHQYKLFDHYQKFMKDAGQRATVEDVHKFLQEKGLIPQDTKLGAFRKNIERGEKKLLGQRPSRSDKIRESGSIDTTRMLGHGDDLDFQPDDD